MRAAKLLWVNPLVVRKAFNVVPLRTSLLVSFGKGVDCADCFFCLKGEVSDGVEGLIAGDSVGLDPFSLSKCSNNSLGGRTKIRAFRSCSNPPYALVTSDDSGCSIAIDSSKLMSYVYLWCMTQGEETAYPAG